MSLTRLDKSLTKELDALHASGRAKAPERIITGLVHPQGGFGPRYRIEGEKRSFLRLNSNSYLSLSHHPALIEAAD